MIASKMDRKQLVSLAVAVMFVAATFAAAWLLCNELMLPGTMLSH